MKLIDLLEQLNEGAASVKPVTPEEAEKYAQERIKRHGSKAEAIKKLKQQIENEKSIKATIHQKNEELILKKIRMKS